MAQSEPDMLTSDIPTDRLDALAVEAATRVFLEMVGEEAQCVGNACLLTGQRGDLFCELEVESSAFFSVAVDYFGDVDGRVSLSLPKPVADRFVLKLFDVPALDWLGEGDPQETVRDALGELGNMLAGLIKGGMTKWFSKLSLGTPKVFVGRRLAVDANRLVFRRQYVVEVLQGRVLLEFCCE